MVQLSFPESVVRVAENQAAQRGFSSLTEYLMDLVDRDANPFGGRESEVEAAILEGIASGPATPMTDEMWQELHRRVREVHSRSTPEQ